MAAITNTLGERAAQELNAILSQFTSGDYLEHITEETEQYVILSWRTYDL